ncbi:putative F-box/LRR-repeat protein [Cardamine amara subsp. amara]|uniref:F-box/LRR-repeat protein n=1 Tax=Cardamine amara subsp. amara TaxID=228776 RepID=A0ABD1CAD7_CARAN
MDIISNLPKDLIYHIISFLSTKQALCLKYASKKFESLVTIIPNLDFESSSEIRGCLLYFVCGILARPANHRLRRFSLKLRFINFDSSRYKLVNECLINVLNRGVLDLELDINVKEDYSLPSEIFTCKSVVKLKLGLGFVIDLVPKNALLPSLKSLILDSVRFVNLDGCAFQKILSACPVLEELVIDRLNWEKWNWSRVVSSLTLERFTARRQQWDNVHIYGNLSFDTPSLEYLEYADVTPFEYPVVNLNSLVEAKLSFPVVNVISDLTNLIKGFKNVQILRLDSINTLKLFHVFREVVPMFVNLSNLSFLAGPEDCWLGLKVLLKKSPNLKTLIIMGTLHYNDDDVETVCHCLVGYSFLLTCHIEVLKITEFKGDIGEMVQIKHVLEKLPSLELLELHVHPTRLDRKQQIMDDLLMFPRVKVKFS